MSLFFILNQSAGQTSRGSLQGAVIDRKNDDVLANAIVTITNSRNNGRFVTETDISGHYSITDVLEGLYTISVMRIGYEDFTGSILVDAGRIKEYNIYLESVDIEIEKVNVTASRVETTLQQTPSSINIIESQEIGNKNPMTFSDMLEGVQGVTIQRTSGINVSSLSLRGSSDVAGGGIGNRVLLLLDGRPSLTGDSKGALWSLVPLALIERTEIVKGAFSSLYGSSAIGGVVNVITKKPTYEAYNYISVSHGFYDKLSDSLKFTNKLLTFSGVDLIHSNSLGKFSYLLYGGYKSNDGHAQQTNYRFYNLNTKFTYDLISNRDIELTFGYTNSDGGYPHYWRRDPGEIPEPFKVAENVIGDRIDKETFSADLYYRAFPSGNSKYSTRFYYYNLLSESVFNPNNPVSIEFGTPGYEFTTFIDSYNFGNISQFDIELSNRNYLISGVDLQWNIVRSAPEEILYGNQQMNNFGVFVQNRHDFIRDNFGNTILSATFGTRADITKIVGGMSAFDFSPKFSLLYSPNYDNVFLDDASFRFLVGKAFRSPSIAEIYFKKSLFGGYEFIFNPNLKPEETLSFEVGYRKQYGNRLIFDIAAYYNFYDNLIQYRNIGNGIYGPFQVQNVAKSTIAGFEVMIDYNSSIKMFNDNLRYYFNIGYSFMQARDKSPDTKDGLLPYKPKHSLNFTTNLNFKDYNLNFSGKFQSRIEKVVFYALEEPDAFFIMNMKLSKQFNSGFSAFIAVNNLFDTFYQELERIAAPNRNFNAGLSFEF
ncbi:MAG: TonB-dependent receptor [Ignavibacteria bacterium]|nr:MAG: TonB-dependent receptor plug [Chlorobi bacterium OLB4]MBV6398891.1 Vitamin B12 transporter BtuB [Ignavibacteria bacterium]MCE7952276.1 TonB-dependent receptor [Chlorobi bacterium CHB7]